MSTAVPDSAPLVADPSPQRVLVPLIPGLILLGLVVVLLALSPWRPEPPAQVLAGILDQPNPIARGRALADFQARMKQDATLASELQVSLELLRRVDQLLSQMQPGEKALAERLAQLSPSEAEQQRLLLRGDRDHLQELLQTLPLTMLPVGLPVLVSLAEGDRPFEPAYRLELQTAAMTALAILGDSVERCQSLNPEYVQFLLAELPQAGSAGSQLRQGGEAAARYLETVLRGQPDMLGVQDALARGATAADAGLRYAVASCARRWPGTPAQNEKIEAVLLQMIAAESKPTGSEEGFGHGSFLVHGQAVVALACRGSKKTPVDRLKELLDPTFLRQTGRVDEALVVEIIETTLTAILQLHQRTADLNLSALEPSLERLALARAPGIQKKAEAVRLALETSRKPT